jgi:hypothetical protein
MANYRTFIFNGLEHGQSPIFEFFHSFSLAGFMCPFGKAA